MNEQKDLEQRITVVVKGLIYIHFNVQLTLTLVMD